LLGKKTVMRTSITTSQIRTSGLVAILALIGASSVSSYAADPVTGGYISGAAGLNIILQEPITQVGPFTTDNLNVGTDVGGAAILIRSSS
jgi:hypothetical protein